MVDRGAREATGAEIDKTLRMPFSGERLARAWTAVLHDVNNHGSGYDLVTANALWAAHEIELRTAYLALACDEFGAKVERLDFGRALVKARSPVNPWVSAATRQN